jgi:ArsR family transcriptional regulator, arsenate/arsenite/antimonite-responsive transcriptional repressor
MDYRKLENLFGALDSSVRLQILDLVSRHKEMCPCELVEELHQSQANISRHVGILRDSGILEDRKMGVMVVVRVNERVLQEAFTGLLTILHRNHEESADVDVEARLAERCTVACK